MFPAIWTAFKRFFFDATYFSSLWDKWVAKVRGAIAALGLAIAIPGTGLSEKIQSIVPAKWAPMVGIALAALALTLRAGEKNPPQEPKL
jgi:hypothetical protein